MGDWSHEPWGNDEAADWFHCFWRDSNFAIVVNNIESFDPTQERYDSIRAACHVIICFGSVYAWPDDYVDNRIDIITKAISILTNMIDPPNNEWGFLEMWSHDEMVIKSVKDQISKLESLLNE